VRQTNDLAPATLDKLKEIWNDTSKSLLLKIELAIVIDAGEAFVSAAYTLEKDGPLAVYAYEEIQKLYAAISTRHFLNTAAVACHLTSASGSTAIQ